MRRGNVHDKPSPALARLVHEVERELASELDEPIIARFGDDEHALDVRFYACAACRTKPTHQHSHPSE